MRKRLRLVMISIVVLLLAAVGGLVGRSLWQQGQQDAAQKGLEFLPGVAQHIQDFHRVKVQDGRKVWEVSAQDAQYFEEDKAVVVRDAMMQLFTKDGRVVGLKGSEARITLDGRDVSRVDLSGDIQVTLADYIVRTDRATYDYSRELISTPGAVEISGRGVQLHGDRMEVQVRPERVTLLQNVSMRLE
ncbi:MAG TPA: LPS export ABC transporter periplasmic protein LptC, partial [Candidatus Acidoferrales bacterium]|nr:LPS export ABC transporter periplasmic protein LptC [Candidatus Acidoferrales bacterium]